MAPPQLSRDAPVADVFHPVEIRLFKAVRDKVCLFVMNSSDGRLGKGLHMDKPLERDFRLHDVMAALTCPDVMAHGLLFY